MVAEIETVAPSLPLAAYDERIREIEHVAVNRPHCLCGGSTQLHLGGCPVMARVYAEMGN